MNPVRSHIRNFWRALFILILLWTVWFFYKEISGNWEALQLADLQVRTCGVLIAFALVVASYFLVTVVWYYGVNAHPSGETVSLMESYAIINTAQMTKYLPGKIWSYTLQTILTARRGVSSSYLLYLNLLIALSLIFSACLFGTMFIVAYSRRIPGALSVPMLLAFSAAYFGFVFLNGRVFKVIVQLVNRVFRRDFVFFELPLPFLLKMQAALLSRTSFSASQGLPCVMASGMISRWRWRFLFRRQRCSLTYSVLSCSCLPEGWVSARERCLFSSTE